MQSVHEKYRREERRLFMHHALNNRPALVMKPCVLPPMTEQHNVDISMMTCVCGGSFKTQAINSLSIHNSYQTNIAIINFKTVAILISYLHR